MRRAVATSLCFAVITGACASDGTGAAPSSTTSDPPQTSTSAPAAEPSSTTTTAPQTTTTSTTTTAPPMTTTTQTPPQTVPGPVPGSAWAVVGVPAGDVLNVRSGPGTTNSVVATLDPQAEGIIVAGDAAIIASSIWWTLETPAGAWVNAWYLAGVGLTEDRTAEVVEEHGSIPAATSMGGLTSIVTATFEGDYTLITVSSSEDAVGGEQVIDVFDEEGDDSVRGYRLHIFGQRDSDSGPLSLYAVEHAHLCWRGVDPQGLCT